MKNNIIILLFACLSIFGCQKSEKDFVGKYETVFVSHAYLGYSDLKYYDVGKIKVEFFLDQAGTISGQGSMVVKGKPLGSEALLAEQNHVVDFDIKNIRMLKDTLIFQFDNQFLSLTGRKFNGSLSKGDNGFIIGIDERMTYPNGVEKSPYFTLKKNGLIFYMESSRDTDPNGLRRKFFIDKVKELQSRLKDPRLDRRPGWDGQKKAIENSLKEVEAMLKRITSPA